MTRPDTREDILSLAACPCCNGIATLKYGPGIGFEQPLDTTWAIVECRACGVSTSDYRRTDEAIARWNRRAAPTPPAAEAPAVVVPDGWKLVPIEPTDEIMNAGLYQASHDATWADVYSMWKDMLAVVDEPPAAEAPGQEPVATVIWHDPALDLSPPKAGKIIDASMAFMDDAPLGTVLYAAPTKQEPVAEVSELLPIFLPGAFGDRLSEAMTAYLADYAYDQNPDQGFADHELTEFERGMMEDFLAGAISDEGVNAILQEAARAMAAPPTYADAKAKKSDRQIVEEVNDLARTMLSFHSTGYEAPEGHKFYAAQDTRSRKAWQGAVEVYEQITGSEVHDALLCLDDDEPTAIRSLASPAPKEPGQ